MISYYFLSNLKNQHNIIHFIFLLVTLLAINSCTKNSDSSKEQKADNMNESIQTTFFDTPFGASKEELISNFQKHGLRLKENVSDDYNMTFEPIKGEYFSFENLFWKQLLVILENNKFCLIQFCNTEEKEHTAKLKYKVILSTMKSQYNMTVKEYPEELIYDTHVGVDGKGHKVVTSMTKSSLIGHNIYFSCDLVYMDSNILENKSDEL